MSAKPFIDTNILIYAYVFDDRRNETALALIAGGGVVSVQVLNEFVNVARRKLQLSWEAVERALAHCQILFGPPAPLTLATTTEAIGIAQRYGCSFYDSLILSSAKQAGCRLLYTEDMQHGQTIEGVLIRNPFADT